MIGLSRMNTELLAVDEFEANTSQCLKEVLKNDNLKKAIRKRMRNSDIED